jgi:hypothetical protein
MRRYVWSRNLKNEDAMARVGPQSHMGGGENYGRQQDNILLFKIDACARKDFYEMCGQFEQVS